MTEWILTRDRLPSAQADVLITMINKYGGRSVCKAFYWPTGDFYVYELRCITKAPAWMPLPEPYKEEDNDV